MSSGRPKGKKSKEKSVENYKHTKERVNLPTEETIKFMGDDDRAPIEYKPPIRSRTGPILSWDRDDNLDNMTHSCNSFVHT